MENDNDSTVEISKLFLTGVGKDLRKVQVGFIFWTKNMEPLHFYAVSKM